MHRSFKEKRRIDRIPVNEEVIISHKNMFYSGKVLNLSEKGMFIGTKKYFPFDSRVVISFRNNNDVVNIFANIKYIAEANRTYNGIGVELYDTPQAYLELIDRLR
jgi:Tfp pilus assembly protein PilZ